MTIHISSGLLLSVLASLASGCIVPGESDSTSVRAAGESKGVLMQGSATSVAVSSTLPAELTDRSWHVSHMGADQVPADLEITMNFSQAGRLHGSAGCNGYVTAFGYDDGAFSIGRVTASQKACLGPAEAAENAFLAALANAKQMRIEADGTLVLAAGGAALLRAK